ncbi:ATP-binding cassette domain-containing protein [Patescibacteria group bacterium]|nr:ATP-binding cassette domain-containing protein [Patescibacteria group bacterium]
MTLLQLQQLSKAYGTQHVLDGVGFTIADGQKIGLIGRNGAGKSTLLRIIAGQEAADQGEVVPFDGLSIGYLEQHAEFPDNVSVQDFLETKTGKPAWSCAKEGARFGLTKKHLAQACNDLSGGYRMRILLTILALQDPTLLLLDEPTNHLDLQTQFLLEAWLNDFRHACLIISHDRTFLKTVCDRTIELERGKATVFPGDIDTYQRYKEERDAMRERFNKNVEEQREHLADFINRFRAKASKATQAQSKLKQLHKLNTIEIDPPLPTIRLRIPQVEFRKTFALRTHELTIGYGDTAVASGISFEIQRGERIAIVGENGQGKSTLLKTLSEQIPSLAGTFTLANRLKGAVYAQHVTESLDPGITVMRHLELVSDQAVARQDLLQLASDFLFKEDDLEKPISVLSGGERARLCLAGLLLGRPDILFLDEPTNHLDLETTEALAEALTRWKGTALFVSHARTFVKTLATRLLQVRDGRAGLDPRTYDEYVADTRRETVPLNELDLEEEERKQLKRERRERSQELKRQLKVTEKQLDEAGKKRQQLLDAYLANPTTYSVERQKELHQIETVLAHTEHEWLRLQAELEELQRTDE